MMETKLKDSGIPWIGQIPEHWEVVDVRRLFYEHSLQNKDLSEKNLLSLSYGNIIRKNIETNEGLLPASFNTYNIIDVGDIVFRFTDLQNDQRSLRTGLVKERGIITSAYVTVRKKSDLSSSYFHKLFHTYDTCKVFYSFGGGVRQSMKFEDLQKLPVLVPPIEEQERIAAWLDEKCGEIDELVEVEQLMISDLEAYRQAIITEAVTHGLNSTRRLKKTSIQGISGIPEEWNEVNLLKVIYFRARLGWRGLKAEEYVDEGYPFLSAFNIVSNNLQWANLNFINKQRYDESPEIKLSLNDILIVKDGAGIGKCARVENMPLGESTVNSSLGVITVSEKLYYSYLFYFFLSTPFQNNVYFLKNGMGVPHLTQENMKSVRIPLPPILEQKMIADYLDAKCAEIDELIKVKQEKIETLKQYRQSLIFEAVTGKTAIN